MRSWLREHGYKVADRGRISDDLVKAYETKTPAAVGQKTDSEKP